MAGMHEPPPSVQPAEIAAAPTAEEMPAGFTCERHYSDAAGKYEPFWSSDHHTQKTSILPPEAHKGWICRHSSGDLTAYPDKLGQSPETGGVTGVAPSADAPAPQAGTPGTTGTGGTTPATPPDPNAAPEAATAIQRKMHPSFNEQCLLMDMATEIKDAKLAENNVLNGITQDARVRQIGMPGYLSSFNTNLKYVNKITLLSRIQKFFEITPNEAAQLAHYAHITEVVRNQETNTTQKQSIFPSLGGIELTDIGKSDQTLGMFQNSGERSGSGIRSIDIAYEGIDSFTKKIVSVKATFAFQDIRTMMSPPFVELFRLSTNGLITGDAEDMQGTRTIDFELGWKSNSDLTTRLHLAALALKLQTNLVMYTFDLSQDGSIVVNATYRGHIVDVFSGPGSNILSLAKGSWEQIKERQEEIEKRQVDVASKALEAQRTAAAITHAAQILKEVFSLQGPTEMPYHRYLQDQIATFSGTKTAWETDILAGGTNSALGKLHSHANFKVDELIKVSGANPDANDPAYFNEVKATIRSHMNNLRTQLTVSTTNESWSGSHAKQRAAMKAAVDAMVSGNIETLGSLANTISTGAAGQASAETQQATAADIAKQQQLREANKVKYMALRQLAIKLLDSSHIHYAYVSRDKAEKFKLAGATGGHSGVKAVMDTILPGDILLHRELTEEQVSNEDFQVIPFIFFGKLVEQILELPVDRTDGVLSGKVIDLMKKFGGSDFSVDMGYSSFEGPYSGKTHNNFPLYYFPVSLMKINNFMATEVLAKERTFFAFNAFILSIIQKFFTSLFSVCTRESNFEGSTAPKIIATTGTKKHVQTGFYGLQYFIHGFKNVVNDIRGGGVDFGNYQSNFESNIYHFFLGGQAKGAVKTVKVSDIADQTSKTAIYYSPRSSARDGNTTSAAGGLQPAVFQATVETIGFPLFNVGQLIYVDLRPFITEANGRQFKANGYYGVHKVSHSFSAESFTSKVESILQFSRADRDTTSTSGAPHVEVEEESEVSSETAQEIAKLALEQELFQKQQDWLKRYQDITPDNDGNRPADAVSALGAYPGSEDIPRLEDGSVDLHAQQKTQRMERYNDIMSNSFVPYMRQLYDNQIAKNSQNPTQCATNASGQLECETVDNNPTFQQFLNMQNRDAVAFKHYAASHPDEANHILQWNRELTDPDYEPAPTTSPLGSSSTSNAGKL